MDMDGSNWKVGNLDFSELHRLAQPLHEQFYHLVARTTVMQIFRGSMRKGQIHDFDGSGPFDEEDLRDLAELLGMLNPYLIDDITDLEDELEEYGFFYIVVGRSDWDTEFLDWVLEQLGHSPGSIQVLSQEDFVDYWLFNRYTPYSRDDPRVWEHPALKYLAEHSGPRWPWPSTEPEPSVGTEVNAGGWRKVHPLKARFGYTVSSIDNLSDQERQRCLDLALNAPSNPLTLLEVVNHIAWQARWRKRNQSRDYAEAIAKWERDLAYLKQRYYRNQFRWPEY